MNFTILKAFRVTKKYSVWLRVIIRVLPRRNVHQKITRSYICMRDMNVSGVQYQG